MVARHLIMRQIIAGLRKIKSQCVLYFNNVNTHSAVKKKYQLDFEQFSKMSQGIGARFILDVKDQYPCLHDNTASTEFDRHYVYHPAWAARMVNKFQPKKHVDISSILGFSTILSAFIPVEFYDYRPAKISLSDFSQGAVDLLDLNFKSDSIHSLSCMHVIEHIGLGRYGDPLNPDGDIQSAKELSRVLAVNGQLLIALPVGRSRVAFNAHRIYSHEQVLDLFKELELVEFSLIPDGSVENGLIPSPSSELINSQSYGCGCYVFTKRMP